MSKSIQYSSRLAGDDLELREELEKSSRITGQSVNTLIMACVRIALPRVVETLQPGGGRITNVEPLPDAVLERLYSQPEEEDEAGVQKFMAAQASGGDD